MMATKNQNGGHERREDDDNESGGIGYQPKSPWKRPEGTTLANDGRPFLSNGQQPNNSEAVSAVAQTRAGQQKPLNASHRHGQRRHHRAASKHNPNGVPPFPANVPYYQRPFVPRDGMLSQPMSRDFMQPPFFGPNPPFVGGPGFHGPAQLYYMPAPPPVSVRGPFPPHFIPLPMNHWGQLLPPEISMLMENIVKQIDYYFSDENLQTDHYLISKMDAKGWVPISTIADFRRVKRMCTDIPFILDALHSSIVVEVQGDKVRKREHWSKYIVHIKHPLPHQAEMTETHITGVEVNGSRIEEINEQDLSSESATIHSRNSDSLAEQSRNRDTSASETDVYESDKQTSADGNVSHNFSSNSCINHVESDLINHFHVDNSSGTFQPPRMVADESNMIQVPSEVLSKICDIPIDFANGIMFDEKPKMERTVTLDGHTSFRR